MIQFAEQIAVFLFILTYAFAIAYYNKKFIFVWISAILLLILGIMSPIEAFKSINWNVLGIYFGMLFISELFVFSKIPDAIAVYFINKARKVSTVLILIALLSGFISIAIENVAVVLIVAPIALSITRRLKVSPVPVLTAIAVSSNLQGVATLIGDPPSMLMAGFAKMTFNDFFSFNHKPSLFFAVQIGALASIVVLYFVFRSYNHPHKKFREIKPAAILPGILILLLIFALAVSSSFDPEFRYLAGSVTAIFAVAALFWYAHSNSKDFLPMVKRVDWETGFFLIGIFILVQSLVKVGFVEDVAKVLSSFTHQSIILTFFIIILVSLVFSAFIDNVPFIATMLPVVKSIAFIINVNPTLFYFGLLIAASVGGNITPLGASANIVAMGIAKKEGYKTKFWDFVKIGLPFTLVSTAASCIFIYYFFA